MIGPFVIVLLASTVVIVAVTLALIAYTKRRRAWLVERGNAMAQYGWYPAPPNPWLQEVAARLYAKGRAHEMFAGDFRGRGLCVLEYMYTTSNGKSSQTHHVNLIALNLPAALPPLTVSRDSTLKRAFGNDIELESQAFNDTFQIDCADPRYASAVLHPQLMEWMLLNPALEWQLAGNALVSWAYGQFTVPDVLARLEAMTGVIDHIPPFVLRDYGAPL
ncbi:hypothetical protein GCM10029976_078570 [Kribbella albertanoniae]|uniref:DUF3137 domain-containing protein n=1 Tax=Kribbella albertanoniae TaxID=1266829 RepID=A0A4R4P130_9ACTN|nr:hypothetical protein [Kribbella albertanoniae]TDC15605.1 hypothetical protein E1261_40265 [Kribbella albertanoniae]